MSHPIAVTPEEFDPDIHVLPIAGELLLAGATAIIRADGRAYVRTPQDNLSDAQGYVIEFCKPGDLAEITAQTTNEDAGGIFINKFWVLRIDV